MPANEKEVPEFFFNSVNTRVKKCCASCIHKKETVDNVYRICKLSGKKVKKDFLCRSWHISKYMDLLKTGVNG